MVCSVHVGETAAGFDFLLKTTVIIYSLKKLISQLTLLDAYLIHELPFQSF